MIMEPDSLPVFISAKNKHIWIGKRRELAQREEALHNIALQSGVPLLPQSTSTRIIMVYTDCIGVSGTLVGMLVLGLIIVWFISAADHLFRYTNELSMMVFAFILSMLLMSSVSYARRTRDLIIYPSCVIRLYQQLIVSGEIAACQVQDIEMLDDSNYLIRYQFTLERNGQNVKGEYVTNRPFQVGTKMVVLYLDATCHVLL